MVPRKMRCCSSFGICLSLFGVLLGIFWDKLIWQQIQNNLVLRPDSMLYEIWQAPPIKVVLDIYFFNWTNPEDFRNPAIKPKFQEVGPYRFTEQIEKANIVWHAENSSVTFNRRSLYHFIAEESIGTLDDPIVTINSVAVLVASLGRSMSTSMRTLIELGMIVYPRDLTLRKTVDELLFGGYNDLLMDANSIIPMVNIKIPIKKFGYAFGRNLTTDYFGTYNVHTGANDTKKVGEVQKWNYEDYTPFYLPECNQIRGSTGEFYGSNAKPNGTIKLFLREFCRDITLDYDGEVSMDGVKGYKYIAGDRAIDNGTLYPENKCYCNGDCMPSGAFNVSSCWYNAQIFVSYPHFYKADPYYLNQVEGLSPQKEKHELSFVIEPKTGIALELKARGQVNQLIQPISYSRMFRDVPKIMFPILWAEGRALLTSDMFIYFRAIGYIVLCGRLFGGACCLIGLIIIFRNSWQSLKKFCFLNWGSISFDHGTQLELITTKESNLANKNGSIVTKFTAQGIDKTAVKNIIENSEPSSQCLLAR